MNSDQLIEIIRVMLQDRIITRMDKAGRSALGEALRHVPVPNPIEVSTVVGFLKGPPTLFDSVPKIELSPNPMLALQQFAERAFPRNKMWIGLTAGPNVSNDARDASIREVVHYVCTVERWIIRELAAKPIFLVEDEIKIVFRYRGILHYTEEAHSLLTQQEPSTELARSLSDHVKRGADTSRIRLELQNIVNVLGTERPDLLIAYPALRELRDTWVAEFRSLLQDALKHYPATLSSILTILDER